MTISTAPTKTKFKHIVFTIDSDYEELVEAVGLDYIRRGSDLKVSLGLTDEELATSFDKDPEIFCSNVLNPTFAESCSKATVRKAKEGEY